MGLGDEPPPSLPSISSGQRWGRLVRSSFDRTAHRRGPSRSCRSLAFDCHMRPRRVGRRNVSPAVGSGFVGLSGRVGPAVGSSALEAALARSLAVVRSLAVFRSDGLVLGASGSDRPVSAAA